MRVFGGIVIFTTAACLFTGAGVGWFLIALGALSVAYCRLVGGDA